MDGFEGNAPPDFEPIPDQVATVGQIFSLELMASDPEGQPISFGALPLPLPDHASFNPATGLFTFQPQSDQVGSFELEFSASDGTHRVAQTVTITVTVPDSTAPTEFTGRLLDANAAAQGQTVPVVGASVTFIGSGQTTSSDAQGNFTLTALQAGARTLAIDSQTADPAPDGSGYASFRGVATLAEHVTNSLEAPIHLPRIDPAGVVIVDPAQTTVVENTNLGVSIQIAPHTALNPDGSDFSGEMSISMVPPEFTPMQLPRELQPGLLFTIQPSGVRFAQPVPITFPNIDNLPAGYQTNTWSLSDSGRFIVVGIGLVSADSSRIETISGGVRAATWHFPLPQPPQTDQDTADNNDESDNPDEEAECQVGSSASLRGGCLKIRHQLPGYQSLGVDRGMQLAYRSSTAYPNPLININSALAATTATPVSFGMELLSVGGVEQNFHVFVEPLRDVQRHAAIFDARQFPTGRYAYQLMLDNHYAQSVVGARVTGQVLVNNQIDSPLGAGWQIIGPSRLIDTDGDLLLQAEDGGLKRFGVSSRSDLFLPAGAFSVGSGPLSITAADFNGDGVVDLATANDYSDDISVLLGNGDGSFQDQQRLATGNLPYSIATADFNGDGVVDMATANALSNDLSVLLGNGDGSFQDQQRFTVGENPSSITAADFNSDGVVDLATANEFSHNLSVLLGNGDGSFQNQHRFAASDFPEAITAADFNGDGAVDLAIANYGSNDLNVLLGDGAGSFRNQQRFAVGENPRSITAADFNGDGVVDLAAANFTFNDLSVLLGNGDGSFQNQQRFAAGGASRSITAADFNGDGAVDLATANDYPNDLSVLLGNGDGTFQNQQRFAVGDRPFSITAADFNGDGVVDLAAANFNSNDVSVLLNQADPNILAGPLGDHTTIKRQADGTFIRFFSDGAQVHFDAEGLETSAVDPNGNTTSFAYDGEQRLVSSTDPVGMVTQLRYAGAHLSEIEDPAGRITRFSHDAQGNLIRITNPDGTSREFGYDDHHLLVQQTNERGKVTEYTFDATGHLVMSRLPDGSDRMIAASRTQALVGNPESTSVDNPAPAVPAADIQSGFINGDGTLQTFRTDRLGKITERTNAAGLTTLTKRDANGNPTRVTLPDGTIISATYDQRGNLTTLTDSIRNGTRRLEYQENFNRLTAITDSRGNTTALAYDARGNLTGFTSPLGRALAFTHDARGLTTASTDALGTQRQFEYNSEGNLTRLVEGDGASQRITDITYTNTGRPATLTNAAGQISSFDYDPQGRLTQVTLADGRATGIAYDDFGNPIGITPPGRPGHQFNFNDVNLETAYDPPDIGVADDVTRMEYNPAQQLTAISRPDGRRVDFGYDSAGRLSGRSMPAGSTTLGYNPSTGRVVSIGTSTNIDLAVQWNGFLPVSSTLSGALAGQVSQDFDSDFFLISEAVNGQAVTFDYDNDGLLVQAGALSLTHQAASGLLAGTNLGVVTESIDYNAFAEPVARQVSVSGNPFFSVDFARDKLGRITALTETAAVTGTKILAYTYDSAGRLVEARQDGVPIETYTFDANSNRIQSSTAAGTIDYDYDDQDRLIEATGPTGATTYAYTDAGELQSRTGPGGTTTYDYDAIGNLRAVTLPDGTAITYLIDGLDRRVGKKVNGTLVQGLLYRDLLNPVAELDGQGNVIARFVYGEQPNVPAYMVKNGNTYSIVADHLGSPRLVIDTTTGEVVQQMDYNTFGRVITDTNPGFQPFGFAGGLYDSDTGLIRFGARDYDPETGRWTAKDPIGFGGGDPNLYGYVLTDPVNLIDPSGQIIPLILAGAAVGAVVNVTAALIANGGSLTGKQIASALATGAIAGAAGALAGPLGGTVARALGGSSAGIGAASATAAISAAGSAAGQGVGNAIDYCHASSLANAALFGGLGGGIASKFFPSPGIFTLKQAQFFAPSTFSGISGSSINNAFFVSSAVGAAANFGGP